MGKIAILHGAGYTGGELIRCVLSHPRLELVCVTSRSFAGRPLGEAHPWLRGAYEQLFADVGDARILETDAVLVAAEHGQGAQAVLAMLRDGYEGVIVDLSADFRFRSPAMYPKWFGFEHPAPALLDEFVYGLPEVHAPYPEGTRLLANPGCFATAVSLALWPLSRAGVAYEASVTALTGASGSGVRPKDATHFPTREGNVRSYKVFGHQHQPEMEYVLGPEATVHFVPSSGPWTRGIWGTAHLTLSSNEAAAAVGRHYDDAYTGRPLVRLWPGAIPELRFVVGTPFFDVGWKTDGSHVVIGFSLDNLLKGASSQAVQNLNLLLGFDESEGLIPSAHRGEAIPV